MFRAPHLGYLAISFSALAVAGCPKANTSVGGAAGDASYQGPFDSGAQPVGEACTGEGTQQFCACDGGTGNQVCTNSVWSVCDCSRLIPTVTYDGSIGQTGMMCKGGYYTGTFTGTYWSGAFDLGFGSLFPVTVNAQGMGNQPGLAITLEKKSHSLGEFGETYTVSGGCVIGNAEAAGTDNPFVGLLTGDLDCETGKFTGVLDGYYKLLGSDIKYYFKGPVQAMYLEPPQLGGGMWTVKEKQSMAMNGPGGSGTWSANWQSDTSPALPPECQSLLSGDAGTPTTTTSADAGP